MFSYSLRFAGILLLCVLVRAAAGQDDNNSLSAGTAESFTIPNAGNCFMRWCPAGTLTMQPQGTSPARVEITEGFWIAENETTQLQFDAVMGINPWDYTSNADGDGIGDNYPANSMTHAEAIAYCDRLSNTAWANGQLARDWKYSLPTAAQWEFACRAGTTTAYSFGDSAPNLKNYAWYLNSTNDEDYGHQVRRKLPNPWGLYDMHGNVLEWCLDGYKGYGKQLPGGQNPFVAPAEASEQRVVRGGCFGLSMIDCRSNTHGGRSPETKSPEIGFRIVKVRVR